MTRKLQPGMQTFVTIWGGQFVSLLGTGMTRFALMIWTWQQTGEATSLALLGFFAYLPYVLISPLAGLVVDRSDRRVVMMLADMAAGVMTIGLLALYATGALQIWHLYASQALSSLFEAFQLPAYAAATTMLVEPEQYGRTSGMRTLAENASTVLAPILGGALVALVGISGVMVVDVATFLVAMVTLSLVRVPRPEPLTAGAEQENGRWRRLSFGFRFILARPGLTGLLLNFVGINLLAALTYFAILPAMVLARSGSDELALGVVQGALGVGGVAGGLLVSIWGGPRRRIHGCLAGAAVSFLLGDMLLAIGRTLPVWTAGAFLGSFFVPIIISSQTAIWLAQVPADVQGRVFSARGMLQPLMMPLGYLVAGPLADRVFEPAMAAGGSLVGAFSWLVGSGPGAGMGLMFACTCVLGTLVSLSGYLFKPLREIG